MAVKQNFKEVSGGGISPYRRLLKIFVHIRDWSDSYEIARVKKWQARDPAARAQALEEMSQIRHAVLSRLSDPAHDVEALLRDAALEKDNLSLPHQGNLQQMQKTFDEMRAFMPFGKKAPQQDLLAYEQTLDRAFRGWAATLAYAESDPQRASQDAVKMIAETVGGPMDTSIYMSRLSSAARPGMPGPDAVPAKNNAGARPASSATLSL